MLSEGEVEHIVRRYLLFEAVFRLAFRAIEARKLPESCLASRLGVRTSGSHVLMG